MQREQTDILISGGGVAGLVAAAAFGAEGFRVVCVDPAPPVTDADDDGADLRSTAFLQPAVALLRAAGVWDRLAPEATALQVMRLIDADGDPPAPRATHDFDAAEISDQPFGWNLPNWLLRRELVARLRDLPTVDFRPGTGFAGVTTREATALVRLSDGARIEARLLIGADGRGSPVREAAGIGVRTARYGQKALAFAVTHPLAHDNVSTEIHLSGGPFTLVPLPDQNGVPASAVVWMERGPEIRRLRALCDADFAEAMTARSCGVLGPLTRASQLTVWPIISQIARRFTAQRTALMAEAAHVAPPIGAQGLNMSLADLAILLELARARPETLGDAAMLDTYERRRAIEVPVRVGGVDMLNRAAILSPRPLRDARAAALGVMHGMPPLRRAMMRLGLGLR